MEKFVRPYPYSVLSQEYINWKTTHHIAKTLFDFGVTKVRPSIHYLAGKKDLDYIDIFGTSIVCEPDIQVLYKNEKTPLLWAILKYLSVRYSGYAGDGYMQASFTSCGDHHLVKHYNPEQLISGIILYHQVIMEHKQ